MNSNLQSAIGPITMPQFGFTSLNQAINTFIPLIFAGAALIAFFYLLYAGLRFITSGGSDEGTKAARAIFRNVMVGLFLLAIVFVFFRFIVALVPGLNQYFSFVQTN
jgi:hypothetical protein